jgi:multidrug resistance efflux pump
MRRIALAATLLASFAAAGCWRGRQNAERGMTIRRGELTVWSSYAGTLDARHVEVIMSQFAGVATIVELAPEGTAVEQGDRLVRFDSSQVQRDLLKIERDYALAKAEVASLEHAKLPLELQALEVQLLEAQAVFSAEQQSLEASVDLRKDDLVSDQEIEQQKLKVARARSAVENLKTQSELTRVYLHPAALDRARATLSAAEQELVLARLQMTNCTVTAPSAGVVVYRPLHIGTEYRTVRVGDTVYRNQPFLAIPDMRSLLVQCLVPEAELARVQVGSPAVMTPLAYPNLEIEGSVESVGSMAQDAPGRANWQKYFPVVIRLDRGDPCLRSGMSVSIRVLSYRNPAALLVPRAAVWWQDGESLCRVQRRGQAETRKVVLGEADLSAYEGLKGLEEGEMVVAP